MPKTAHINARIEPALKVRAERIFQAIGVSASDAVTMFYRQVVLRRGMPFDVCIPNAVTRAALEEAEAGGGEVVHDSTDRAFDDILGEDQLQRA